MGGGAIAAIGLPIMGHSLRRPIGAKEPEEPKNKHQRTLKCERFWKGVGQTAINEGRNMKIE